MAEDTFSSHLGRLRTQLSNRGLQHARGWIERNTYLRGQNFNFEDHEYQLRVIEELAPFVITRKCSQIGVTELTLRMSLAFCNLVPGFTTIYTMPTAAFARTFVQTRVDPVITSSRELAESVDPNLNNTEVKRFGDSFLYVKGTIGAAAAISVPADMLVHDELDFSDPEVVSNYESRLTHSKYKLRRLFSTPTDDAFGVSLEFQTAKRSWLIVKCSCCGHHFIPDYYQHVRLPGFTGDSLRKITKHTLHKYNLSDAFVECPRCGGKPDLSHPHREWVWENPDENFEAIGIQIQPFDAPQIITPGDLIRASTRYTRTADFINFSLGLPASDELSSISKEEVAALVRRQPAWQFGTHVMGLDMGLECHCMIAGVTPLGELRIVHTEIIDARSVEERRRELCIKYRVILTVVDQQPYTETVWRMQASDPNLYSALFIARRGIETHMLRTVEEDDKKAQAEVRELQVNRNRALDAVLDLLRTPGGIEFREDENTELLKAHLTDMRRIKDLAVRSESGEEVFVWRKSKNKQDHFHFALLYCWLAAQLRGLATHQVVIRPLLGKIKVDEQA